MTENKIKMPVWRPYSKKYMGISKIIKRTCGKVIMQDTIFLSPTAIGTVRRPCLMLRYRQTTICGVAKMTTHFTLTDTSLCGKIRFMPTFLFQKQMMTPTL